MDKYRPCPSIIAMFTSDSQHPPRSKHAVYLGAPGYQAQSGYKLFSKVINRLALKQAKSKPTDKHCTLANSEEADEMVL